jgi:hypothetical protein
VESVLTATIAALRARAALTALVHSTTGIYNNVEQGAAYDYLEVTSPTDRRVDTYSNFGSEVLVNVKVVSQSRGDQVPARILNQCVLALSTEGGSNPLTLAAPFRSLGATFESSDRYAEVINGITTRYHVGLFRVWTEQTS